MPWFITTICSNDVVSKLSNVGYERPCRTFGFFNSLNKALNAIENNTGNMNESFYDYLILEYIKSGIHPTVLTTRWFVWNYNKRKWISTKILPTELQGTTNFALG